ncbi:STM3941 family protein [uncultured Chryseobacterium sp.]|uniref:STM3941 family protein n=1 Tax=uncultured Chryseobacterium sp. TaxID=259322 RepID=UPI00345C2A75
MNEIHFYSSKIKSIILLILSSAFVYLFIHFYEELLYKSLFRIIIGYLGCILFSFGIVYSMLILFRQKPLLTINNNEIIIYDPLRKKILVPFENVGYTIQVNILNVKTKKLMIILNSYLRGNSPQCQKNKNES